MWREGCEDETDRRRSIRCRAAALERVLQYRLSGYQHFDERGPAYRAELLSVVFDSAEQRWSRELKIPDQSIPIEVPYRTTTLTSIRSRPARRCTRGVFPPRVR